MPRPVGLVAGIALMLTVAGCATSRKITTRDELARLPASRPITVFAQDDRVYLLHHYALADSFIHGSGTVTEKRNAVDFNGDIPFAQIIAIKTDSRSVMKGLVIAGITAMFVTYFVEGAGNSGLEAVVGYRGGGGSSCPYVYAWDGNRYALQAEPFGTAWGRALELTTWHMLPAARAERGVVRVRIANEREETHYLNSINLLRIELGAAPRAVLDAEGTAWPLLHPVAPVLARDRFGKDILAQVTAADDQPWECEPSSMTAGTGYEDVLELSFTRPQHALAASLVLTGINTTLSASVYSHLCRLVGDQTPALAHAVETDPELIAELRDYVRDAALAVSLWDGHAWVSAGAFQPEANAVAFARALRIVIPDGAGDTVLVRLRSMADVWRIDAIAADWGEVRPLPVTPVQLRSAIGPGGEDLRGAIGADDDRYAVLLPPDRVELTFADTKAGAGGKVAYAVAGRGYLMEWEPRVAHDGLTAPASWAPAPPRIAFLKELLRHRDLALGPVYEDWRKLRVP